MKTKSKILAAVRLLALTTRDWTLNRAILGLLLLIGSFAGPLRANAALVSISPCPTDSSFSCITAIDDLTVLGDQYDVTVAVGTFSTLFPDPSSQLLSWDNDTFAKAAMDAIIVALNSLSPRPTNETTKFFDLIGDSSREEWILHLPIAFNPIGGDPTGGFGGRCPSLISSGATNGGCANWLTDIVLAFAVLTPLRPRPVTEPGTLALLGLGLLGIGLTRRRAAH